MYVFEMSLRLANQTLITTTALPCDRDGDVGMGRGLSTIACEVGPLKGPNCYSSCSCLAVTDC